MQKISDLVISLENEKGEDIEIRTKKIDEARKNLGHWKELQEIKIPKQFKQYLKPAIETLEAIFTAGLTRKEAATIYEGVWRPKVEYTLGQTYLTDKQVNKIESASLPKIIAKCGYNRTMARAIRGSPKELGGVGFTVLINSVEASRIQHFLKNWRTPWEDIGKTLRVALVWTQYCAGVPYPILLKTKQNLSYVNGRTILETRRYLHKCHGITHLDTTYVRHPRQEKDMANMHLVNTQTTYKVTINQQKRR